MTKRKNDTYVMINSDGKYLGQGFFTAETARQYAITYMQQNKVGVTYAKIEGHIPFVPEYVEPDGIELADFCGDHPFKQNFNPWEADL